MKGKMLRQKEKSNFFFNLYILAFIFCLHTSSSFLYGQARDFGTALSPTNNTKGFDWDKVIIGGGFGAAFGTITTVDLSPTIGYKIKDFWLAGIGARYIYYSDKRNVNSPLTINVYGGGPFTQLFFLENFLAHTEYEFLQFGNETLVQSWLVGGGYRSFVGGNSYFSFLVLWDLIQDLNSPYRNPILRINFGIGL